MQSHKSIPHSTIGSMRRSQQGAYRTAAARASQYNLELDHLRHSRDNSVRREHELERALDDERQRAHVREADLKRRLRNSKCALRLTLHLPPSTFGLPSTLGLPPTLALARRTCRCWP
jgi:hypothetical protein